MTATASVGVSGDPYIDGVLSGTKWGVSSLTYGFPTDPLFYEYSGERDTNFKAFTAVQQDAIRDVLAGYSAVANITFTEITESSTQHATLRFAESDSPGTAWAYYPTTSAQGGDAWFNNSKHYYDNPVVGTYGYHGMIHEIGHALGLKHPHDVKGSFGAIPADKDSVEYSVMSYHSYLGSTASGYTNGTYSYSQTLMMYDIAALQTMYGANYSTNNGSTVYSWSATTGEMFVNGVGQGAPGGNKVFMTIWDGGGNDTYDFSNYATNLKVDLDPGGWTTASTTQLASLGGGYYAAGNIANALLYNDNPASLIEDAIGGLGADNIVGNIADNHLTGGRGNDVLDGGAGVDTAVYSGLLANYSWTQNADGSWTIADLRSGNPDGIDTLWNMELLQFGDTAVTIGSYTPPPPPPPPVAINHAPTITSVAPSVSLSEWADLSTNEAANTPHTASGAISFTDADVADAHAATFAAEGTGYLGTFALNTANIDSGGSLGWSFTVSDSAIDYLKVGQSLTQKYDVAVDDGHGGTAMQTVTIILAGADDATAKKVPGRPIGKGGGNDIDLSSKGADVLLFLEMQHDQAAAPALSYPEVGIDLPEMALVGLAHLSTAYAGGMI